MKEDPLAILASLNFPIQRTKDNEAKIKQFVHSYPTGVMAAQAFHKFWNQNYWHQNDVLPVWVWVSKYGKHHDLRAQYNLFLKKLN